MVKLIVCDIDNTLVPKHKLPSENTIRCIRELRDNGILFGLASGRDTGGLKVLADKWGIECDLLIGNNGGEYLDCLTGEHDILPKLDKKYVKEIFDLMSPFKDKVNTFMVIDGQRYCRRLDEATLASFKYAKTGEMPIVVEDESMFWAEDQYKAGFRTPAEVMPLVEAHVAKHPSNVYKGFKTEFTMFEFAPVEADKGKQLIRFAKNHNIPIEDVMGIGDMTNDVSLIADAGIGVCMKNGSDDAKAVADIITEKSIEDDGWADFIQKNVLDKINK